MKFEPDQTPRCVADEKGAVESDMQDIVGIDGAEVLGYTGLPHGEHSGQALEHTIDISDIPDFIPFEEPELVR